MRRDFLEAYRAGKQAAESKWDWKNVVIFVIAVVIANFVERWLSVRYSLPWFESYLLSFVPMLLVVVTLITLRGKLRV